MRPCIARSAKLAPVGAIDAPSPDAGMEQRSTDEDGFAHGILRWEVESGNQDQATKNKHCLPERAATRTL